MMIEATSYANLVIAVGQASCAVAKEIEKLSISLSGSLNVCVSPLYITDELVGDSKMIPHTVYLEKCSHSCLDKIYHCTACDRNRGALVSQLTLQIESIYAQPNKITIISDYYSSFGSITSNYVSNFLSYACPGVAVISVLLQPYSSTGMPRGSEVYIAILSALRALDSSEAVVFRGFHDIVRNFSQVDIIGAAAAEDSDSRAQSSAFECGISLDQAHKQLACDLFTAVADPSLFSSPDRTHRSLWPVEVCSNAKMSYKISDVRSSLFKYLSLAGIKKGRRSSESTAAANYNPVRSLAANIHSLHSCYNGSFSSAQVAQRRPDKMVIESASLAYLQVDRSSQKIVRRSDRDGFLPERSNLFTLLLWATGSDTPVYWPSDIIGLGDPNPSSSCGGSNRGAQRSRRLSSAMTNLSTASRPSSAASSASTVRSSSASLATARSAASTTTSSRAIPADSNSGGGSGSVRDAVVAVSFRSPYGVRDLAHLGHQAALMLQSGAFTHLFGPDCLYTVEDLWDAVFVVQVCSSYNTMPVRRDIQLENIS